MRLNKEQKELVIKNHRFVPFYINKMNPPPEYIDDWISMGNYGLVKAAASFDKTKGIKFTTYAAQCIRNEILMHLRKQKKEASILVSLEEPVVVDATDNSELTLAETLADPDGDFREAIENKYEFEYLLNIILNLFQPRDVCILLYRIAGMTQRSLSQTFNISQSYISRILRKMQKKLEFYLNNPFDLRKIFRMEIVDNFYRISYSLKNSTNFSKISASLPDRLLSFSNLPNYRVIQNNKKVTIELPSMPESFYIVAQFIQVVDSCEPIVENEEVVLKIPEP